jgi:hypothetical protein
LADFARIPSLRQVWRQLLLTMKFSRSIPFLTIVLASICFYSPSILAQTGFGPPLPTHPGPILLDLNPDLEVDEIPGLLPKLNPVVTQVASYLGLREKAVQ